MDSIPDITGFYLDEALQICNDMGFQVSIVFTRPDKVLPEGKPRVVRFHRVSTNIGVMTVVCEDGMKGGG